MNPTVDGLVAGEVARPSDVDGVRDLVRAAADRGAAVIASGLGAHLDIGGPPRRLDVLLRMDGVDRIIDHQPADMTITVEAGCSLARLDATLATSGQWLPLDPPSFDQTTVGGLVAANLAGPLRASQGTVRDLLLGLRVVDAEGALVSGGGRVVKNVAGYDLPKLHVGALGTLGVIVEATFKVRPRPEREEAAILAASTYADAAAIGLAVRDVLDPLWIEAGTIDGGIGTAIGVGGITAEIAAARRAVESVARRHTTLRWIEDGMSFRRRLAESFVGGASSVLRASVLPAEVGATITRLREVAGDVPVLAHLANGIIRARFADPGTVAKTVATLRPEIASRGGFLVVERAGPDVKIGLDVWGDPGEGLELMRRVKATFDPQGMFAPGRYVGGI